MGAFARFRSSEPALLACVVIAAILGASMYVLQGRLGINLQDEAFLWYGTIQTHAGELPLRDFRAYDPGRYFWCAAFAAVFGDGLVAVRGANWAFAAIGITAGLLVASRASRSRVWLLGAGVVLALWSYPHWKPYESSTALLVAWSAVRLVESPSAGRRVAAGIAVGLAAFFGRNLGLYAGLAMLVVTLASAWRGRTPLWRGLVDLALGTLAGYSPMLLLVVFADGFRDAFVESIVFYTRQGALNVEMPMPFPWRLNHERLKGLMQVSMITIGTLFLVVPIGCAAAIVAGILSTEREGVRAPIIVALGATGLAWFHHASVRSDLPHLAQSIQPFLLLVLFLPALSPGAWRTAALSGAWIVLAAATALGPGHRWPFVRRALSFEGDRFVRVDVRGDELLLPGSEAELVRGLEAAVATRVDPGDELWVAPQFLGLYPILGRRSPTWDIYPAWSASPAEEERMLAELAHVRWALVDESPVGGTQRLRLQASHPRVWAWLGAEFERVPLPDGPDHVVMLRRRR